MQGIGIMKKIISMGKKITAIFPAILTGLVVMASCSDNNDADNDVPTQKPALAEKIYMADNGLVLTYNGQPMVGKSVRFIPDSEDASKARIEMYSTFYLLSVVTKAEDADNGIAGPGVLPGSPEETLEVTLVAEGGKSVFSGEGTTDYCMYTYDGEVSASGLSLNIKDVQLKDKRLCGTWTLAEAAFDMTESCPIYIDWESDADFTFMGLPLKMNEVIQVLMTMPLLDDNSVSIPEKLATLLKEVRFMEDGNIVALYTAEKKNSPANMMQYVVGGDRELYFFLNPATLVAAMKNTRASEPPSVDVNALLENAVLLLNRLRPMLSDGIPLNYIRTDNDNGLKVYLDTELLLPLLQKHILPLLRDEAIIGKLMEYISQNKGLASYITPEIIANLADVIEETTKVEIGLSFKK